MALNITSDNFEAEVVNNDGLIILKFGAAWCGPCKKMDPIIEEISKENDGIKVCYIDIDSERNIPVQYGVLSVPTTLFFKGGKVQDTIVGLVPKNKIQAVIDKHK